MTNSIPVLPQPKREIFTHQELVEFIRTQPHDRVIDMRWSRAAPGECGCILAQFARHKFGNADTWVDVGYSIAGIRGLVNYVSDDRIATDSLIGNMLRDKPTCYAQARDSLDVWEHSHAKKRL